MKISYHHLSYFFNNEVGIDQISDKLFQLGHEHEINNNVFDIEFTPNRGDCLSVIGLVRDLSAYFDVKKEIEIYGNSIKKLDINFTNNIPEFCPRISFMLIEIENDYQRYDSKIQKYFELIGVNKNNLFADISNYLSYETGQPTHCYDYEKLKGPIVLKEIKDEMQFKTITGSEIKVNAKDAAFIIDNKIANLAGVMGGIETACSENTSKVLVECAYFCPENIIGKSIKYNLNSDAAYKFERGVDPCIQEHTLRRFAKLIEMHCNIKDIKFVNFDYRPHKKKLLDIDLRSISKIIGTEIKRKNYKEILEKLDFKVYDHQIEIPSFRSDIATQNDVAEEIARVIGYNNIKRENFKIQLKKNETKNNNLLKLKNYLVKNGFFEVVNSSFVSERLAESILIDNPLDKNKKHLRTNLKQSLINNLTYNEKRQKDSIKFFEVSDVYTKESTITKTRKLGVIASGRQGHDYINFSNKIDRVYFENLVSGFSKKAINLIELLDRNKIESKSKSQIYYLEVILDEIEEDINELSIENKIPKSFVKYKKISEYPATNRDISYAVDNKKSCHELQKVILNYQSDNLKDSFVFDFYEDMANLKVIKIGFRFTFQNQLKTLTDKEVDKEIDEIIKLSTKINGVKIPGL